MWVIDNQQYLGRLEGWNRATQFADGLFETMVVKNGVILALERHVKRLSEGLSHLHIASLDRNLLDMFESYAHSFTELSGHANGTLKIIVSRGDSQRGYGYDANIAPHVTAFFNELSLPDLTLYDSGVPLTMLKTQCMVHPQLAGLKHLNRLENVLAKSELAQRAYEGIMQNHLGFIIEGTMSNIVFEKDGQLITPDLSLSGVKGVMRECVKDFANIHNIKFIEKDINVSDVAQFSQGFICNSVVGILPIQSLSGTKFTIGEVSKRLINAHKSGEIYA